MHSGARRALLIVIVLAIAAGAAYWWWNGWYPASVATAPEPAAPAPAAPASAASAAVPTEPAIQYPVQSPTTEAPLESSGIAAALDDLLGRKAVNALLQTDDFPHRFAATVDNLGRSYAPASLWPINPTPDRFQVQTHDGNTVISADNSRRYTALVLLVESVDTQKAVDLYIRMYPLLQHAYQDLGYPKAYFNDRLIQVIDLLLASPDPGYPVNVQLTNVKGPEPSLTPWVRYQFANPALESLTSGQKIMVRVGSVNERRLKAKLRALRKELLTRVVPR
ncbi:MAG: DUF3014 domain-containing protein [Rhodoferax sp.]